MIYGMGIVVILLALMLWEVSLIGINAHEIQRLLFVINEKLDRIDHAEIDAVEPEEDDEFPLP